MLTLSSFAAHPQRPPGHSALTGCPRGHHGLSLEVLGGVRGASPSLLTRSMAGRAHRRKTCDQPAGGGGWGWLTAEVRLGNPTRLGGWSGVLWVCCCVLPGQWREPSLPFSDNRTKWNEEGTGLGLSARTHTTGQAVGPACHPSTLPTVHLALASGSPSPHLCPYNLCSVQSASVHNKPPLYALALCA